jgi:hypothetical protein
LAGKSEWILWPAFAVVCVTAAVSDVVSPPSRPAAIRAAILGNSAILDREIAPVLGFSDERCAEALASLSAEDDRLKAQLRSMRFGDADAEARFVRRFWTENEELGRMWTVEQHNRYQQYTGLSR